MQDYVSTNYFRTRQKVRKHSLLEFNELGLTIGSESSILFSAKKMRHTLALSINS